MRRAAFWLALALVLTPAIAAAQSYPVKPIRIVTAGVGGGNDWLSRVIAQGIAPALGQQLIVDNRGGGVIPGEIVARAPKSRSSPEFGSPLTVFFAPRS